MFEEYSDMLNVDDLCEMLSIGKTKAYQLMRDGKIHAFQLGRVWRISKKSIIEYVETNTKNYS